MANTVFVIMFVVFIAILVGCGFYAKRWVSEAADYVLAGREVSTFINMMGVIAIGFAGTTVALAPGFAIQMGLKTSLAWGLIYGVCGLLLYGVLWGKFVRLNGAQTLPEFLEMRYSAKIRPVIAVTSVIGMCGILANNIVSCVSSIVGYTGWNTTMVTLIVFAVILCFTFISGLWAATITDFFQALLMCFGATFVFVAALIHIGGLENVVTNLKAIDPILVDSPGTLGWNQLVGITFVYGFAPWGLPQLVQKGFAMRDKRVIKPCIVVVAFLLVFILFTSNANGAIARAIYGDEFLGAQDTVFPIMVARLLPEWAQGLVLAGVTAAAMSTLDSVVLVMAGAVANDIYKECINPKATSKTLLRISQVAVFVVFGLLALIVAGGVGQEITFLAAFSHTMMASMCAAPLFGGMFWKKGTTAGVIISQLCGVFFALLWYAIGQPFCHFFFPAIIMSFVGYFVGSKFGKPLPEAFINELFPAGERQKAFHWGVFNSKQNKEIASK